MRGIVLQQKRVRRFNPEIGGKNDFFFYGRADDAYAAIEYLKTLPEIDANRIGVSGHSQGGWIAQITAAKHDDVAFIICLAGPTVGVKEQIYSNDRFQFECEGYEGDKLEKKIEKRKKGLDKSYNIGKNLVLLELRNICI